jgi:hypothetical protein
VQVMAEGQTVKHETYGLGIVTASDQERTAIDFDDHGPKLFVTSIMVAELIGEAPAPPQGFHGRESRQESRRCYCCRCRKPFVVPFSLHTRSLEFPFANLAQGCVQ